MGSVALLEVLDDAESMEVVVEAAAVTPQTAVKCALPGMAKRWMPDIVDKRKRLRKIFLEAKFGGSRASDLRNLHGVGQAAAKVVRRPAGKHLGLARQPAESARLHNPLAVALKRRPGRTLGRGIHTRPQHIVRISWDRAKPQVGLYFSI